MGRPKKIVEETKAAQPRKLESQKPTPKSPKVKEDPPQKEATKKQEIEKITIVEEAAIEQVPIKEKEVIVEPQHVIPQRKSVGKDVSNIKHIQPKPTFFQRIKRFFGIW